MIRATAYALFALILTVLSGCKDDQPTQSVEWYKAHPKEREAVLSDCRNAPGDTALSPNCINAGKAASVSDAEKRRGLDIEPMTDLKLGGK